MKNFGDGGIVLIAIVLSLTESTLLAIVIPKMHSVLYIGSIVAVVVAFGYIVCCPITNTTGIIKIMSIFGKDYSMVVYFIHPIIGKSVELIAYDSTLFEIIHPLVVLIITIFFAIVLVICKKNIKRVIFGYWIRLGNQ